MSKMPPPPLVSASDVETPMYSSSSLADSHKSDSTANEMAGHAGCFLPMDAASHPGLLQMLLNAEKSQDLIWTSIRSGGVNGSNLSHLTPHHFPYIPRLFDVGSHVPISFPNLIPGSAFTLPTPSMSTHDVNLHSVSSGSEASEGLPNNGNSGNKIHRPVLTQGSGMAAGASNTKLPAFETSHEVSARLLFMVIRWIKSLPTFRTLSKKDQLLLLEDSWKDLFLVNMAQWSVTFELSAPMISAGSSAQYLTQAIAQAKVSESTTAAMGADLQYIQEILRRFRQLSPDGTECSCLKAVILFKPGTLMLPLLLILLINRFPRCHRNTGLV